MTVKTKKLIKWAIITLLGLSIITLVYWQFSPKEEKISFITAQVEKGDIENNVMASGKIKAINTVDVGAQVSGEVTKLAVKIGDVVKKGDLIAQINPATQRNQLSNSQASLTQSKADLYSAQQNLTSEQANLTTAKATLASRKAELAEAKTKANKAQSDLNRLKPLLEQQAISKQDYDDAVANVSTANASVATAQANIASAKANIKSAQASINTAEANIANKQASVQKAQTDVSSAQEDLGYTTITAPISGTVVSVTTEQGSTVNANQSAPTIVTIADLSKVRINAQISEADIIKVKAGMPVYFNVIGSPDDKIDAVLTDVEPAPEQISDTSSTDSAIYYIGYIEVPNTNGKYRIDMTAQVYIIVDQVKDALTIPSSAINEREDPEGNKRTMVRVLTQDDKGNEIAKPTPVKIGLNNNVNAEVINGLKQGEKVVISESNSADTGGMGAGDGKGRGGMGGMGGPPPM